MLVIYGAPAVGKTTLVAYLRNHSDLKIMELDEEIKKENKGVWPEPAEYRNREITPKVLERVAWEPGGVFVTSGLNKQFISIIKNNGGKVALLYLSREKLIERNNKRMSEIGHDVLVQIEQNLLDQEKLKKEVGFDYIIDANRPVDQIAGEVLKILKS